MKNNIPSMEEVYRDPILIDIKRKIDGEILNFVRRNSTQIINQAQSDSESEIPSVPVFDNYLLQLETRLKRELNLKGFFNGVTKKLIDNYRETFYYSSLPNLIENQSTSYKK